MKCLSKILIIGVLFILYATSAMADYTSENGNYSVEVLQNVGPGGNYWIYQPTTLGGIQHPLAVYCIGANGNPESSQVLFNSIASHGVIIIMGTGAHQSDNYAQQAKDGIDWLIAQNDVSTSDYYQILDTQKVMAFGMSDGGNAALWAAIGDDNIKSVVSMAPGVYESEEDDRYRAPADELEVPVLYLSGGADLTVYPWKVHNWYFDITESEAWYACKKAVNHMYLPVNPAVGYYIRAWVYTHLFDDTTASQEFYGQSWGLLTDTRFKDQERNF